MSMLQNRRVDGRSDRQEREHRPAERRRRIVDPRTAGLHRIFPWTTTHRFVDTLRDPENPDAVFIALHGGAGEDGSVQAVLEWMRIPYQRSPAFAQARSPWTSG